MASMAKYVSATVFLMLLDGRESGTHKFGHPHRAERTALGCDTDAGRLFYNERGTCVGVGRLPQEFSSRGERDVGDKSDDKEESREVDDEQENILVVLSRLKAPEHSRTFVISVEL
ncbi:hypothetical protein DFH08DRAFT_806142 [Mycena albidolilacea]|uniref:Uncharacterized protein n=1 Tax=Mycena albidolilacea TaxID=1033008 RepID=A0AAD7A7R1_9AGAR|nr:hypothetical protein DFH08DRAFT_806142 [Mycena albidolilacea]